MSKYIVCVCVCARAHACTCTCTYSRSVISDSATQWTVWPARHLCPWKFPGKNTGEGCHFLLQEIFLTQGLNPCLLCLLHWRVDSLLAEPPGKQIHYWSLHSVDYYTAPRMSNLHLFKIIWVNPTNYVDQKRSLNSVYVKY